ncbi:unnamed protein product, partial [Staurois parvus]
MTRDCRHSTGDEDLVGHVTGPRRLRGHSQSAALLAHAQWAPGCELSQPGAHTE